MKKSKTKALVRGINVSQNTNTISELPLRDTTLSINSSEIVAKYKVVLDSFYKHPWLASAALSIARTISGTGWSLNPRNKGKPVEDFDNKVKSIRRYLENKYVIKNNKPNIKDTVSFTSKIFSTVLYYVLFGFAAWETIFDDRGAASGFDFINAVVIPNIDSQGYFKEPAFIAYPFTDSGDVILYNDAREVVFFSNPSLTGNFIGHTFIEPVLYTSVPADIYAERAYLNLHKNNARPPGIWIVNEDVDDEEFDQIYELIDSLYRGTDNYGYTGLVVRGGLDFKEFRSTASDDMPFIRGRQYMRDEISSVLGVPTPILGISEEIGKSNLQEVRRDFYERTLRPLMSSIEEIITNQVIVRYFKYDDIAFEFNKPDFLKAVERSAVARRYFEIGALSPNEVRQIYHNLPPRPGGDFYINEIRTNIHFPENSALSGKLQKEKGGPPEDRVDSDELIHEPGDVGNYTAQESPRVSVARITKEELAEILEEVEKWKRFSLSVVEGKREYRKFIFENLPEDFSDYVDEQFNNLVLSASDPEERRSNFYILYSIVITVVNEFFEIVESIIQ